MSINGSHDSDARFSGMDDQSPDSLFASYPPAISGPLRILVVDDQADFALLITRQFRELQLAFPLSQIEVVHNWEAAMRAVRADPPPHIALVDLKMPESDGELSFPDLKEAVRRAVAIDEIVAVVIVTGTKIADVEDLLVNDRIEVLHKDSSLWNPGTLVRAAIRAMERKSLADERGRFAQLWNIVSELKRTFADAPTKTPQV